MHSLRQRLHSTTAQPQAAVKHLEIVLLARFWVPHNDSACQRGHAQSACILGVELPVIASPTSCRENDDA